MEYLTTTEAAERWGIAPRRVQVLCRAAVSKEPFIKVFGLFLRMLRNQKIQDVFEKQIIIKR
jgi:hypothetical protein